MKSTTYLIVLILGISIFLPSCSVEKRLYNKGFHVSKKGNRTIKPDESSVLKLENITNEEYSLIEEVKSTSNEPVTTVSPIIEQDEILMTEASPLIEKEEYVTTSTTEALEKLLKNSDQKKPLTKAKKKTSKKLEHKSSSADDDSDDSGVLFGALLMALGVALLLFVSLLVGVILLIIGLVVLIVGASKSSQKVNEKKQLQDVVYLKNGSIIRGTIIEQIPSVSIKIQTAGGSVFVYKMNEIEKMTKEESI